MRFFPNEQIDDHGGTTGAVLCWAAARHRDHRPVRVNSVREQERRLTGAGLATLPSVPVSFEFRLRGDTSTHAHRRRAVALLPEQLVAANSPARVERFNAPRRRNFRAQHHVACKLTDAAPSHSTKAHAGLGDTQEAAMYRAATKHGVDPHTFWALRYRPPHDLLTSVYMRLALAYHHECERQEARLRDELETTKKLPATPARLALIAETEAVLGRTDEKAAMK